MRRFVVILGLAGVIGLGAQGVAMASAPTAHAASVVPIVVLHARDGSVLVATRVVIHGRPFLFVVDTGASKTLVSPTIARRLHLKRVGKAKTFCGVTGCTKARGVRLRNWSVGHQPLPAVRATSSPVAGLGGQPIGLLGSDVLSKFGSVTINYANGTMTLG